jgi:hypothetical protein
MTDPLDGAGFAGTPDFVKASIRAGRLPGAGDSGEVANSPPAAS